MSEGTPHILWIPSWYPKDETDIGGSFFREQAEALFAGGMTIGVLSPLLSFPYAPGRSHAAWDAIVEHGVPVLRYRAPQVLLRTRQLSTLASERATMNAFRRYCAEFGRPDLLHAHSLYPGGYVADLISRQTGIPWILTEHRSLAHAVTKTRAGAAGERRVVSRAAVRTAVSQGHAKMMSMRFGVAAGQWLTVPNLVRVLPAQRPPASTDGPIIGHLSLLTPVKRVDLLIEAFTELAMAHSDVRLVIAGPNDHAEGQRLRAIAADARVAERITFAGPIARDRVADFMAGLDVFVLPSDSETFGVVLVEALAQGTPVIATRTWGAESIVEAQDGTLVAIGDRAGLVKALRAALDAPSSPEQRERRAAGAIERFGELAFVARWRGIYEEVTK